MPPSRFKSILTLQTTQALFSALASFIYLLVRKPSGTGISRMLGIAAVPPSTQNGNGAAKVTGTDVKALLGSFLKVAMLNTSAGPFGFASLRHISYPTMVLGKSCKLVPVLLMNVRTNRFPMGCVDYKLI